MTINTCVLCLKEYDEHGENEACPVGGALFVPVEGLCGLRPFFKSSDPELDRKPFRVIDVRPVVADGEAGEAGFFQPEFLISIQGRAFWVAHYEVLD